MTGHRVVVTGVGVLSPIGLTADEFWESLAAGRGGIGPIQCVDSSLLRAKNVAEIRGFDSADHFEDRSLSPLDRYTQLVVVAAREASRDSGIDWTPEVGEHTAVVTGSSMGGQGTMDREF